MLILCIKVQGRPSVNANLISNLSNMFSFTETGSIKPNSYGDFRGLTNKHLFEWS